MAIRLEKGGDFHRINLDKNTTGEIIINLDWSNDMVDVDLDLGCFYELRNGIKTVIDGLQFSHGRGGGRSQQTRQGSYDYSPFIWHQGDDRGRGDLSGETILVNPKGISQIKRMTIYTFIFDGVARWSQTNAVVKVKVPGCEEVIVEMGQQTSSLGTCAIAQLDFDENNLIKVTKLVTFHENTQGCDKAYNWGLTWSPTPGTKD